MTHSISSCTNAFINPNFSINGCPSHSKKRPRENPLSYEKDFEIADLTDDKACDLPAKIDEAFNKFFKILDASLPPKTVPEPMIAHHHPVNSISHLLEKTNLYLAMDLHHLAFESAMEILKIQADHCGAARICGMICDYLDFSDSAETYYKKASANGNMKMMELSLMTKIKKELSKTLIKSVLENLSINKVAKVGEQLCRANKLDPYNCLALKAEGLFLKKMNRTDEGEISIKKYQALKISKRNERDELLKKFKLA
jgi:hypothetical protein